MTREQAMEMAEGLESIRLCVEHWAKWNADRRASDGLITEAATQIYSMPTNPTHGQFAAWAELLSRASTALQSAGVLRLEE